MLVLLAGDYADHNLKNVIPFAVAESPGACAWFKADKTRQCETLLGCYIPALGPSSDAGHSTTPCGQGNTSWFKDRWGGLVHFAATLGYLLRGTWEASDSALAHPNVSMAAETASDCIAVHVRRGDACLNPDRRC